MTESSARQIAFLIILEAVAKEWHYQVVDATLNSLAPQPNGAPIPVSRLVFNHTTGKGIEILIRDVEIRKGGEKNDG